MFGRRKPPSIPTRAPHVDPLIEARLVRIYSLLNDVRQKQAHVAGFYQNIHDLQVTMGANPHWSKQHGQSINKIREEIQTLEARIAELHEYIATLQAEAEAAQRAYFGHQS